MRNSRMTRETLGTLVMAPYIGKVAMNLGGRYSIYSTTGIATR
ncbi:MAG: hypothetical protein ACT4QA_19465 [Panacagrimonas sp.]